MILFSHPLVFLLLPLAALLRLAGAKRPIGVPLPLDIWKGAAMPNPGGPARFLYGASAVLFAASWISLVAALAGPYVNEPVPLAPGRDVDVLFAIDVSPSMAAMDMEPNRLQAATSFVSAYLDEENGTSVGIVAFGGEASLACPPTGDYAAVLDRLAMLKPGMLGDGTALGLGLASALGHVQRSDGKRKAVVLITDGEDNVGKIHPLDIAQGMFRVGVFLTVVGIGSRGTTSIEYVDPSSGERLSGAYQSGFDDRSLRDLATAAGGDFRYATGSAELSKVLSSLGSRYAVPDRESRPGSGSPRATLFFGLAFACAALAWTVRNAVLGGVA